MKVKIEIFADEQAINLLLDIIDDMNFARADNEQIEVIGKDGD